MRTYERIMRALWWMPNAVTSFRGFFAAPVIGIVALWEFFTTTLPGSGPSPKEISDDYLFWLFVLIALAAASDWPDGYLAKKFECYGWRTRFGGELDAYADKLLGVAVLYFLIPLHYRLGWYLIPYTAALLYIAVYSQTTTKMRWAKQIKRPNSMAQQKTSVLMAVKVAAMGNIAFFEDDTLLWLCVIGTAIAALMCRLALKEYKEAATKIGSD